MKRLWLLVAGFILGGLILRPAVAQTDEMGLNQYQDLVIKYAIFIGAEDLIEKLEILTCEEWQLMYESTPLKGELVKAITSLENLAQEAVENAESSADNMITGKYVEKNITVEGEFEPRYSNESMKSTYWLWLYSSAYLSPSDGDEEGVQDERCSEHVEEGLRTSYTASKVAAIGFQAACDIVGVVDGAEGSDWVACGLAGVSWEAAAGFEGMLKVCEVRTGNVNSAEIEAGYENSRLILNKANSIDETIGVMKTALESEVNFTDDIELGIHQKVLKDELTDIKNKLDQQQVQLDEIIRLLGMPPERRPDWN